ncbi:beta-N-acetylhexosaminidase [Bacteroides xylanisolvens]|uniref:beta-N-acetylhexosaminidase n=1 Tax=Bacteroides xylanisolvens TaxID=371601 RepID=A0AAW4SXZ0_9BACE|nr:family 20 glycosylhydrolase [Bacteroides xylanisolvens]MCA4530850.1 family 20 glycosylhydrolase [Bacteroides xylanisolvens]MCA4548854.1 family 20 glycosylhydrolase [Bacteroides xylanisolvens]MCA4562352.1 family 20 glycosylhydrolase [Bacteroides xylanisolvens]MCA4567438.1 family 20 glycosylhydrolase [Bacteroides xylanisolvens]MCA4597913.1 family 20 glycosylhydrolase [Bacteroides xylanisolvens]
MFKKLSSSLLIVSACVFSSCTPTVKQEIAILPTPVSLTEQSGSFVLKDGMKIGVSDQSLFPAVGYLQEILRNVISTSVEVTTDKDQVDMYFQLKDTGGKPGSYRLQSTPEYIQIEASDYSGIISAITTIRQLLPAAIEVQGEKQTYSIPVVQIEDVPRFEWRGFMLDASRHFWSKDEVKHVLDLMSLYKLNKFHWHLSDDQGWRIEIEKYPLLTEKGAWRKFNEQDRICMARAKEEDNTDFLIPEDKIRIVEGDTLYGGYYTHDDIKEIVAYATQRGIDVIPEIDMPGHFLAAISQYPELACDGLIGWGETFSSPVCPGKDATLEFCQNVFKEVFELFPYEYVHMGGDEVEKANWKKCPLCQKRIRTEKLGSVEELQAWFVRDMEKFFFANGKRLIGWDEVVADGLSSDAAITWWRSWAKDALPTATAQKQKVIACPNEYFYFDYAQDQNSVKKILAYDPCSDDRLSPEQKKYIWGVQANLWSEWIPTMKRIEYLIVPRMIALSEIAWAEPAAKPSLEEFYRQLVPQFKRMDVMRVNYRVPDLQGFYKVNAFIDETTVDLTCPLPGTEIRYTTDGSMPTKESALYNGALDVTETTDFAFRTFRPDGSPSDVARTKYVKAPYAEAVTAPAALQSGLKAVWHDFRGNLCADIEAAPVKGEYVVESVSIPEEVKGNIGLVLTGYLEVPADGIYTFALLSDDGSTLMLDGELLGDNDGAHSPVEIIVQKALKAGLHPIEVRYFDCNGGVLQMELVNEKGEKEVLPSTWLKHE